MDENLTPEEQQAFSSILATINDEQQEEVTSQNETTNEQATGVLKPSGVEAVVEKQEPIPQPSDVQQELFNRLIANQEALAQQNKILQEQIVQQTPQAELSEEEKGIKKLREAIGVDALEQENAMLKQQLQEIMSMKQELEAKKQAEMQAQEHMKSVQQELTNIKQERPSFNEEAVYEYIMKQPEAYRPMLDTPQGWRMVDDILKNMAQPVTKPDNIIASKATQPITNDFKNMNEHDQNLARTENILRQLGM